MEERNDEMEDIEEHDEDMEDIDMGSDHRAVKTVVRRQLQTTEQKPQRKRTCTPPLCKFSVGFWPSEICQNL